ncbi:DcuS/MalK family sensor histidine kinase [Halomonas getboli]|uniref:DcuS/MalK family sensor histidine kinase n=1 Tax=Halomonas getboli TaxID=2935862 RepID=UPI001FFF4239|nr:DcuS/MalK family sensor histidine kinase [Halomonas getboli]MCK2184641.1 DcuS/MalK family sensor histidine kinase [Halomonas getboli]
MPRPRLRLNTWISLLVAVMVVLSLGLALWLFTTQLRDALEQDQATRVTDLARTIAAEPEVQAALVGGGNTPSADGALQARLDGLRRALGVDFIVVMDAAAIRLTHPDPERIGRHFQGGDEGRALAGETYHSRAEGTLGTSIRGFAPVQAANGEVVGAVSVGVTLTSLAPLLADNRRDVILGVLALMLIGGLAARGLARTIKRVLLGLEPHQIARLVEERQAMLASVHEGILAVDRQARITLANPAARRLLAEAGLGEPTTGALVADYLPHSGLPEMLDGGEDGESELDRELDLNGQLVLANRLPIHHRGRVIGAIATFRDKSEVNALAEQLTGVSRYAEALRAATHEFKNQRHVMLGLAQMGDLDSLRGYLGELDDHRLAPGMALVEGVADPVIAGFLLGKRSEARERGVELEVRLDTPMPELGEAMLVHTLVTVLGNLLENAFDAVEGRGERRVTLTVEADEALVALHVQDTGGGIDPGIRERLFEAGVSTKGERRGLGLAAVRERVEASGGRLAVYSEAGRGTLFEVELPLERQHESDAGRE